MKLEAVENWMIFDCAFLFFLFLLVINDAKARLHEERIT